DWFGHLVEKLTKLLEIGGVESCSAQSVEFTCSLLKRLGMTGGEDQFGAFRVRSSGCFEPDSGGRADYHDRLPRKSWLMVSGHFFFSPVSGVALPAFLFQPWKCEWSPAFQASRSPGVLRSQSGRT